MIGRSLNERHRLAPLSAERAVAILSAELRPLAKPLVEIRARDPRMVACLIVNADKLAVRQCRSMGFDMRPGATAVFGLLGNDVLRFFEDLTDEQRRWLETPCGPRETKVFLVAGGIGLLSVEAHEGTVAIRAV